MIPAEIPLVMDSRFALATEQGHWTEIVYTVNCGIVAVFFLVIFGAMAWATVKWACKRLYSRKARQLGPAQSDSSEGQVAVSSEDRR